MQRNANEKNLLDQWTWKS